MVERNLRAGLSVCPEWPHHRWGAGLDGWGVPPRDWRPRHHEPLALGHLLGPQRPLTAQHPAVPAPYPTLSHFSSYAALISSF